MIWCIKKIEIYFGVLLRVYRLVFITVLMYNPLCKIVMGPYAACKGGEVNGFIKKKLGNFFFFLITARARLRGARARGGDEATTFVAVAPSAIAPREQIANLSHFVQWS